MSIVRITYHNENIFKADSQDDKPVLPQKPKMYRSKFEKSIKEKERELKSARHLQHKTFGFAEIPLPTPDKYLKKDEGIRNRYDRPKTSHARCTYRKPPIPHLDELQMAKSMTTLDAEKNFKLINIKRAKSAVLRNKPGPKCFEQQAPVYINQPKFGNIPNYLIKINDQLRRVELEAKRREEQREGEQDKNVRMIDLDEKNNLLEGLKHNWNLMQKEYQRMPLLIDTVPKMLRKTKLENQLKSLERDICLLSTNSSCIFILPNSH